VQADANPRDLELVRLAELAERCIQQGHIPGWPRGRIMRTSPLTVGSGSSGRNRSRKTPSRARLPSSDVRHPSA
jgi:hypothetical protein